MRTRIPTLMAEYTYANLRAMGSLEALKSATDRVPIKIAMLRYETQAKNPYSEYSLSRWGDNRNVSWRKRRRQ